jgi:PAS domain S-box-containing protein/diguanylate cyclase (GGDEF)-like protein
MSQLADLFMVDLTDPRIFEVVVDSLETGVYLVDRHRKIVYWNHGAERISGYKRQDVTGRFCRDDLLVHCDENEKQLCGSSCPLADCMREGQAREASVYLRHREGHRVPVRVRALPLRDQNGAIVGAAEIFEERGFQPETDRRKDELAKYGCQDECTQLPNQALMVSYLREHIGLFTAHSIPFAVLLVEPERLSHFQAAHGQEAVRTLLRVVGHTLKNTLRPTDYLGRWKGNQFLAILPGCGGQYLESVAHRLKGTVSGSGIQWWGDRLSVTIRVVGTAIVREETVESVVERVEAALQKITLPYEGGTNGKEV